MYSDYLTIILEDKIYAQRTPTSKFVEFDIRGTKLNSYEDLPLEIKDIVNTNKDIEENPFRFLEFESCKTGYRITRIYPNAGTHVKIPQFIGNVPVTEIAGNVLEGVEHQIQQIMLPDTIERFYEQTFRYGDTLRHINIPPMVEEIPALCFYGCYKINNLNLSNIVDIGHGAFEDCMSLTSAKLTNVQTIQKGAFSQCCALKKLTLSNNLSYLGTHAFSGCSELDNVDIPESINILGARTFERCYSLKNIKLPENLLSIEDYCFKDCYDLTDFTAPKNLEVIKSSAFHNTGLKTINLNQKLKEIGTMAFYKCSNIEQIYIYSTTKYENTTFPFNTYDKFRTIIVPEEPRKIDDIEL